MRKFNISKTLAVVYQIEGILCTGDIYYVPKDNQQALVKTRIARFYCWKHPSCWTPPFDSRYKEPWRIEGQFCNPKISRESYKLIINALDNALLREGLCYMPSFSSWKKGWGKSEGSFVHDLE